MKTSFSSKTVFKNAYKQNLKEMFQKTIEEASNYERYAALAALVDKELNQKYEQTTQYVESKELKRTIYFSMEFLMGRLITSNLQNSGYYDVVKSAFDDFGFDLNEIEETESDAGLGNGGLGRLAACFLDSAASLGLPLYGNSLRYQKGFFIQEILNNKQIEHPDPWLDKPFYWEEKKESEAVEVPLFGRVSHTKHIHPTWVKAVPYDVKVVGYDNGVVTHLRLWQTVASEKQENHDKDYLSMVSEISEALYPDDSTREGKILRLQQQYVFSSAGIQSALNDHKKAGRSLKDLPKYYTFQINDTHPTLIIPELMRILMDEEHFGYDEAWDITTQVCAYTNHTILAEALEKWHVDIFKELLPRIYEIIEEMNHRFKKLLKEKHFSHHQIENMALIGHHQVRMANICINGSFSINGVAALHTEILKNIELNDFYQLYPERFNNKTNGITHRRWLMHTNQELVSLLDETIGKTWRKDLSELKQFEKFASDEQIQAKVKAMKLAKKRALINRIFNEQGIKLDENSIFDIQVKRLHQYKRQLMNILHIIYVYLRLKEDKSFKKSYYPHSFIFGAKAAPSYHMAKGIIELINAASHVINNDPETNDLLKVVFVENYNATYAEYIMPAADLSEQISTASKEASGTGNMKFMLNGALTIGTLDGANVEITQEAGIEHAFIFGMTAEEVTKRYKENNYQPRVIYQQNERLQKVFSFIKTLYKDQKHFDFILDDLLHSDYFFVLADFDAYVKAHERANELYKDQKTWWHHVIINIANAGFFTSDRTIAQYNEDIWHLETITLNV